MPVTFVRGRMREQGAGFEFRGFQPGFLTADGGLVKGNRLDHECDQRGDGHEPGDEAHFLFEL